MWLQQIRAWRRRIPLLDRWLLGELIGPLLFAVAAFTVVSLSLGVMFELVRKIVESGLPVLIAIQVLLQRLPSFLVISFPMATLMATLLAYSRLSANSELTALRSVGVTATRMIVPAMVLALLMTSLTFVFNDVVVPRANRAAEVTLRRALGKRWRRKRATTSFIPASAGSSNPMVPPAKDWFSCFMPVSFVMGR